MKFDAFTAGIDLGGLRSKDDIKILICYLISNIDSNLSKFDIVKVLQENNLANYFELNDAFSDLIENKNIKLIKDENNNESYKLTESGKLILTQLESSLPVSVKEHAVEVTLNFLSKRKLEDENTVEIEKKDNGYNITCHISGGEPDLMSFTIYVPDKYQANLIKKNFLQDPLDVYKSILASVTKKEI